MKKNNQRGFSAVEGLLVVVIIGLIGFVGWYLWHSRPVKTKTTITNTSSTKNTASNTPSKSTTKPAADVNAGYLVIKEWGVKIKLRDSDKVTYTYDATQKDKQGEGDGIIDSMIDLEVKSKYYLNKECNPAVGYTRYSKVTDSFFVERATKIGNYYYMSSGSPFNCENDSDNALNGRIREDLVDIVAL